MQDSDQALQQEILDFWFGRRDGAEYGQVRNQWFRKDDAFDAAIRQRFGAHVDRAIAGGFAEWESARRALELFTRLRDETGLADPLDWARRHAEVIRRFGRYPHRNAILDRQSTPE